MAKADAWGAPGGTLLGQRRPRAWSAIQTHTRAGAWRRIVAAEPVLRRAIPILVIAFLLIVAAARMLSLASMYEDTQRHARAVLGLAAGEIANALTANRSTEIDALLADVRQRGMMSGSHVLLVLDEKFAVRAASPEQLRWIGAQFDSLASGAETLLTLGKGAGVIQVQVEHQPWLAALVISANGTGAAAVLQPQAAVLSDWVRNVKLNITLFVFTSGVLLVILYAYLKQSGRVATGERSYAEAHQRIDLALVRGRCGLWDWDMARGRMYWSRSMYEMLGYKPRDTVLSFGDVDRIMHPEDQDLFDMAKKIAAREADQIDRVFRMQHADGQWVWVRARAQVVDPDANELHMIGIAVDVTEQQKLAQRSATSDMRLGAAVECLSESFVLWDSSGRLVMCNDRFQRDLGLTDGDVVPGTSRVQIEGRRHAYACERRLANAHGPRGSATFERQLADGRWLQVNELSTPDGGVVAIGADITQLKQHQEKLLESERRLMANLHDLHVLRRTETERSEQLEEMNRKFMGETERAEAASQAKSEFLANMSHELRTPLNAIIGFSEIMASAHFGPLGSSQYVEYASDIHSSGKHLLGLIGDILDMSKIEAGRVSIKREEIDLGVLINEAVRVVAVQAAEKSIGLETSIAETMNVSADRRAIRQIVINLLSNAVKFTGQGGRVMVRARQISGNLTLTIEDNGCGIPKAALRKLGRPFEQVQNQFSKNHAGSGLGLAISRSLAELHGGALKIRSTDGVGTIVSVRIPVNKETRLSRKESRRTRRAAA